ncbi:MAG: DNA translocase FtsK [Chloroflexi bacterium]|nr:DNA translocase FtsK [Chloroflexota bacterium]
MVRLKGQDIREASQNGSGSKKSTTKGMPRDFRLLSLVSSPWQRREILFALILIALFLWHEPIFAPFLSSRDILISSLGWGITLGALWAALFLRAILKHRWRVIHRWRVWLGTLGLLMVALGILSFFRAPSGIFYDITFGGKIGQAITGSYLESGVSRIVLIFVASAWIIAPGPSKAVTLGIIRGLVLSYAYGVIVWSNLIQAIKSGYAQFPIHRFLAHGIRFIGSAFGRLIGRKPASETKDQLTAETDAASGEDDGSPHLQQALDQLLVDTQGGKHLEETPKHPVQQALDQLLVDTQGAKHLEAMSEPPGTDLSISMKRERKLPGLTAIWRQPQEPKQTVNAMESGGNGWRLPLLNILHTSPEGGISEAEKQRTALRIQDTLADYGIEVEVEQIKPGPTVTMYGLVPGWVRRYQDVKERDEKGRVKLDERGRPVISHVENKTRVKIDSILAREKDLALALAAPSIRIEAPVPGHSLVGVEVPNSNSSVVALRSVMESRAYQEMRVKAALPIVLGKGSGGETVVTDLAKMPHLLIAGATGSGKSVCINTLISCLIMERSPLELRLLLIDHKRVELTPFNGIPHLLTPVIVEADRVVALLKGLISEMQNRYKLLEKVSARNIQSYNRKTSDKLPYIVVAVDELADLMMAAPYEVEQSLCRLAQLGRATGIHLVMATQRPSVDVVTGLIKANFPSRISFAVASQVDSRTILDSVGAEKLLGRGDMLYLPLDAPKPKRLQGAYISDRDVDALVNYWRNSQGSALSAIPLEEVPVDDAKGKESSDGQRDPLLEKAVQLAQQHSRISTSFLQRHLRIGYPKAASLMDLLEDSGVVAPGERGASRDVIVSQKGARSSVEEQR